MNAVDELIEDFADLDAREACELLEELGRELPKLDDSVYQPENLVPGCQSRVWVVNSLDTSSDATTVEIQADSDALVVKGLVYVTLQLYQGLSPQQVLDVDYVTAFDRLGLGTLILPQRKNGLYSLVRIIREFASSTLDQPAPEMLPSSVVAIPRQAPTPTRSIDSVRAEFPILQRPLSSGRLPVFLDSGASAQRPRAVIDKQREVEEQYYANAFRGKYYFGQQIDDQIEATRALVAGLIGAERTEEVIFTSGTTMSINMVAQGWAAKHLQPGDEVLITEMEHHANIVPWQAVAAKCGATVRMVPINDQCQLDLAALDELLTERTALVALCSMSNVLGTMNPIEQIAARARQVGAKVLVDAAQSIPHAAVDVRALDVDFLAFSGHKLYGPSGVGILYGRYELLQQMDPLFYGGHMIEKVGRERSTWAEVPARFEAGTLPIVSVIGLSAAIEFVQSVGYDAIAAHEHQLLELAQQQLSTIPGLTIYGPSVEQKGAIVSFAIDGMSTEDLAHRLDARDVFTRHGHHCAMVLHDTLGVPATTRASFGMYNNAADVEALVAAIQESVTQLDT